MALLPDTATDGARIVGERICAAVRGHQFKLRGRNGMIPMTASIGVATFPDHGADYDSVFAAADRALYRVKRQGRDGAASASGSGEDPGHLPLSIERFVGRVEELRSLIRLLDDSAEQKPRVVGIVGEAGIGKTTIMKQLEPEVRLRAGSLVSGRSQEADVQPPYGPWAEVINSIRRIGRVPVRPWKELPQIVPGLAMATQQIERTAGSRYALLEEIAEYIRLAAQERPLVILLDDFQWADSASWDTLEYLLPQLESERLLICLTLRAEETQGEVLERRRRISRNEIFHELSLSRLTRDELKQWIEGAFHRQDVGREFLAFLYRHTEGNPLFVVQVLRTLVDEGAIWYTGDRWEWRPVSELRLPVAISDLISRRLSRLSPESHTLLTVAAVIGREFDIDLALEAGAGTEDELLDAIDEGVRAAVLQQSAERGGDRYSFTHEKMAEVLRDSANSRRLRKVHESVARARERRTPEALSEIAVHYDAAGLQAPAYAFSLRAADRAKSVYAHQEASEYLRIAERNATGPAELAEVRVRLATVAEETGHYDEAEELCHLAIDWFAAHENPTRTLALRRLRERLREALGQPARVTLESCMTLLEEARQLGSEDEQVALLMMLSQAHARLGEGRAAQEMAAGAVAISQRLNDKALLAAALNRLALTLRTTQPDLAVQNWRQALEIHREMGDYRGQARCHNNLGMFFTDSGQWTVAQQEFNTAIGFARSAGNPSDWGTATLNLGAVVMKCRDFDRARELFGESLAIFAAIKSSERQLYALYNLAHLDRERGEFEAAAELYDVASSLAQRIGQSDVEIGAMAGAGLSLLYLGKVDAARVASLESSERLRARPDWFNGREIAETLQIRLAALAGDREGALKQFEAAISLAEATDFYSAAWLTAECADILIEFDRERIRSSVTRFADKAKDFGLSEISRRYADVLART